MRVKRKLQEQKERDLAKQVKILDPEQHQMQMEAENEFMALKLEKERQEKLL
jgi:hypothetical protein